MLELTIAISEFLNFTANRERLHRQEEIKVFDIFEDEENVITNFQKEYGINLIIVLSFSVPFIWFIPREYN